MSRNTAASTAPDSASRRKAQPRRTASPQRTQAERSARTRARLIAAATDVLIDQGYARASVQAISQKAELSQGALFRQFATRQALLRATAQDIGDRLIENYLERFHAHPVGPEQDWLRLALSLVRDNCRSRLHQAWFELLMAARTDKTLREALAPVWARNAAQTERLAAQLLPDIAAQLGVRFGVMVDAAVSCFHGETVDRFVRSDALAEQQRLDWLTETFRQQINGTGRIPDQRR